MSETIKNKTKEYEINIKEGLHLTKKFIDSDKKLLVSLGEDMNHNRVDLDLCEVGHLIMAGVPGSGKTVCLHTILTSLLFKNSYEDLKLVLIDSKKVELEPYHDLPHLVMPILTEPKLSVAGLKWVNEEIDKRKNLFNQIGISNFLDYEKLKEKDDSLVKLPKIVIIADGYADLFALGRDVVDTLVSIAQRGSRVGIHMILSTVRPNPTVIFGTLKAAIPTRIAFRVIREDDSKVILDEAGAENLKGNGDMLLKKGKLIHLQGDYIEEAEVEELCKYIRDNYSSSYLVSLEELSKNIVELPKVAQDDEESVLYQVAMYFSEIDNISISNLQIRFGFGFNRAHRIITELEDRGIISEKQGLQGRKLLVDKADIKKMLDASSTKSNKEPQESIVSNQKQEKCEIDEFIETEEAIQASQNSFVEDLDPKTKDILIKYNLLECILKASRLPSLINLDLIDYLDLLKNRTLFAYCNEIITKDELPTIKMISEPKNTIDSTLNISYSDDLEIATITYIVDFIREKFPSSDIIYGVSQDNDIEKGKIGILALFVTENN